MNKSLYNKIMLSVAKVVKESINETYNNKSIYDRYISFDELSILNNAGNIGDILQINQFGEYRVKPGNSVNESMFDDIDFEDDYGVSVSDKLIKWKDFAKCFGEGLWVYLDWVYFNKYLIWAQENTKLYNDEIPDTNGYENTQYILNNYKNNIKGTIWEEVQNCKYNVYIPDKNQLTIIYKVNKKYNLLDIPSGLYWSSSQYMDPYWYYDGAYYVYFYNGNVYGQYKTNRFRSVALLHF